MCFASSENWLTRRDDPGCYVLYLYDGLRNQQLRIIEPGQTISACIGSRYMINYLWYLCNEEIYRNIMLATQPTEMLTVEESYPKNNRNAVGDDDCNNEQHTLREMRRRRRNNLM